MFTEVTSVGGPAITLAESGAGKVTSFAGSVYTVATSVGGSVATTTSTPPTRTPSTSTTSTSGYDFKTSATMPTNENA